MPAIVQTVQLEEGDQKMTFTDDDLKEYKERAIKLDRQHTLALLARLEAAENCMEQFDYDNDCKCSPTTRFCRHQQAYAVWLSAAGL